MSTSRDRLERQALPWCLRAYLRQLMQSTLRWPCRLYCLGKLACMASVLGTSAPITALNGVVLLLTFIAMPLTCCVLVLCFIAASACGHRAMRAQS